MHTIYTDPEHLITAGWDLDDLVDRDLSVRCTPIFFGIFPCHGTVYRAKHALFLNSRVWVIH